MFDLIDKKIGPLFEGESPYPLIEWGGYCSCCGRHASSFENQGYLYSTSDTDQVLCKTCTYFVQPNSKMGFEKTNVPYRLNSFKGGYLIIPTNDNEPCEIWLGGKYVTRFIDTPHLICKNISGNAANLALLQDKRTKLVISLSPRRELFLKNMRLSDAKNLFVASDLGCTHIHLQDVPLFESVLNGATKKENEGIASLLSQVKKGYKSKRIDNEMEKLFDSMDDETIQKLSHASNNPDSLIFIVSALKTKNVS